MPYGQMYSVSFDAVGVTAAQDLFELVADSAHCVIIHSLFVGQSSDMGDAQAEALKIQFYRGFTVSGSGGSAATPAKMQTGNVAATSTAEINNTTVATTSGTIIFQDIWNVQLPYQFRPTPEERLVLSPSQRGVWRLPAPADSLTMSGTMIFEELGG